MFCCNPACSFALVRCCFSPSPFLRLGNMSGRLSRLVDRSPSLLFFRPLDDGRRIRTASLLAPLLPGSVFMSTDEERSKDPFFFQLAVRPSPPPLPPQMFYAGPPPPPLYSYAPPPIGGRPSFLPTSEGGPFRFPTHPIARDVGHHFQLADPPPGPNTAPDFPVFYDPPMRRDRVSSTGTGRRLSAARRAETNPDAELREEKRRRCAPLVQLLSVSPGSS